MRLSRPAWDDMTGQVRTIMNLLLSDDLAFERGGFEQLADWDPVLRYLHAGIPPYGPARTDLRGRDPFAAFTPDAADAELAAQLETTVHRHRVTTALGGPQSAIILVDDLDAGIDVVNAYAAEHLEIQTADAAGVAGRIRSAGAIFVGPYAPVSLGDYCAGSNHVLPTAGSARHSSGLSVQTFLRGIHVVDYTEAALKDVSGHVVTLATSEDLPAHGVAVRRRFER